MTGDEIKVKVIDKNTGEVIGDFYDMFIECLEEGKNFEFQESLSCDKLIVKTSCIKRLQKKCAKI